LSEYQTVAKRLLDGMIAAGIRPDANSVTSIAQAYQSNPQGMTETLDAMDYLRDAYGKDMYKFTPEQLGRGVSQYKHYRTRQSQGLDPVSINSIDWDPTAYDDDTNEALAGWYKKYKALPQTYEQPYFDEYLQQYKRDKFTSQYEYTSSAEDKAAREAGLPPLKVQTSQGIAQEFQALQDALKKGTLTNAMISQLLPKAIEITDWTVEQSREAEKKAADEGGKPRKWSFIGSSASSPLDVEYLKQFGYDEKLGFKQLLDELYAAAPMSAVEQMEDRNQYRSQFTPTMGVRSTNPDAAATAETAADTRLPDLKGLSQIKESDLSDPEVAKYVLRQRNLSERASFPEWGYNAAMGIIRLFNPDFSEDRQIDEMRPEERTKQAAEYLKRAHRAYTEDVNTPLQEGVEAFGSGFVNATSLGMLNNPALQAAAEKNPTASSLGQMVGMIAPTAKMDTGADTALRTFAPKLTNEVLRAGIKGGASFAAYGLITDIVNGKPAEEVAKSFLTNAVTGALGDAAFKMASDFVGGWVPKYGTPAYEKMMKSGELQRRLQPYSIALSRTLSEIADQERFPTRELNAIEADADYLEANRNVPDMLRPGAKAPDPVYRSVDATPEQAAAMRARGIVQGFEGRSANPEFTVGRPKPAVRATDFYGQEAGPALQPGQTRPRALPAGTDVPETPRNIARTVTGEDTLRPIRQTELPVTEDFSVMTETGELSPLRSEIMKNLSEDPARYKALRDYFRQYEDNLLDELQGVADEIYNRKKIRPTIINDYETGVKGLYSENPVWFQSYVRETGKTTINKAQARELALRLLREESEFYDPSFARKWDTYNDLKPLIERLDSGGDIQAIRPLPDGSYRVAWGKAGEITGARTQPAAITQDELAALRRQKVELPVTRLSGKQAVGGTNVGSMLRTGSAAPGAPGASAMQGQPGASVGAPNAAAATQAGAQSAGAGNIAQAASASQGQAATLTATPGQVRAATFGGADPNLPPTQKFRSSEKKQTLGQWWRQKIRETLDPQAGAKPVGEDVYQEAILSKNAGTQAGNILERQLVGPDGRPLLKADGTPYGSLMKTMTDNLPEGQVPEFYEYMLQRRNVATAANGKPIFSQNVNGQEVFFSAAESARRVQMLDAAHPEWAQKAQNITDWLDAFNKEWLVDTGLLDKVKYAAMRADDPNYLPANRFFDDLEQIIGADGTVKGFIDQTAPVKHMTGSARDILDPTENIINLVNRTVRTARKNKVGQLLVDAVKKNPAMAKYAEIVPVSEGMFSNVDNMVQVLVEGKPVYLRIKDADLLDTMLQLNASEGVPDHLLAKVVSRMSRAFKDLITTKNPIFAVRNMARDIPTYLTNTQANPLRAVKNLARAGGELVGSDIYNPLARRLGLKEVDTPQLNQYRGLGGEGANFTGTPTARTAEKITGMRPILNKAGEIIGYKPPNALQRAARAVGETFQKINAAVETAPRYAEYLNALAKGKTLEQALYDAAEITVNFSRGGKALKAADRYVPFLNASAQGLARLGRALDPRKPRQLIATILKGGAAITLPTVVLHAINEDNPNYQALDNRTKDNYFLIPNPFDLDAQGQAQTFIKIPKAREYGVLFGSLFERTFRAMEGDEEAFKGWGATVATNFAPANPIEDNLLAPLSTVVLGGNEDFAGRSIVPESMRNRSPHLQYDDRTSEISKWFAQAAYDVSGGQIELSPKIIDYLVRSYTGVIGQVGLPATTEATYQGRSVAEKLLQPVASQFTSDPLYSNQTVTDFYDELDRLNTLKTDRNFRENIESGASTPEERQYAVLNKASQEMSALSKQLTTSENPEDIRRQMIQIAEDALAAAKGSASTRVYPAGVDDQKRDEYDKLVAAGVSEDKLRAIFARFAELKPVPPNTTVTVKNRKDAAFKMIGEGKLTFKEYSAFIRTYYPND
jgi:hypothetical protein